jgi:hypothetical protein
VRLSPVPEPSRPGCGRAQAVRHQHVAHPAPEQAAGMCSQHGHTRLKVCTACRGITACLMASKPASVVEALAWPLSSDAWLFCSAWEPDTSQVQERFT